MVFPLWLILMGVLFGRVAMLMHENHLFATEARHVTGTVLKKVIQQFHGAHSNYTLSLFYTYTAGNLQGRCLTEVEPTTFIHAHVGGPLPIAYLPEDPTNHRIDIPWENAGARWGPLDDFIISLFAFVPGVGLIWHFAWRNRIYARLMAAGIPCWGEVTALKSSHHRASSDTYLTFRFTTAAGREVEGRTPSLPPAKRVCWQEGDPIQVFYDPKNPGLFAVDTHHPLDMLLEDEPAPPPVHENLWA
jgi:hypothetical protein